ncbi:acyl-CoA dehydrogenase family protein [Peribacillus cavernae]|uniref:acyl-CoA dehydrogenase family protein n=1 Tax=Peribacillus cavernae TaxID=1674310 RepID=UPI00248311D6|nr:acyl-CoA dehydrogenase family protein [Peribacillus cavernae]MDQ0219454.1 alkylation response protein AidB-like acyl-CoA dehydrogenase [Peribacillus cavernae]
MWDRILSEEEKMLRRSVRSVVKKHIAPLAQKLDEEEGFPWEQIRSLADLGILGILTPEEYGGAAGSKLAYVLAVEEVAKGCAATALVFFTQTHGALSLLLAGSEEQKQKYLPQIASGEILGAIAITEPNAGSDAAGMATIAVRDGNEYILNGNKVFITTGDKADVITVFAKTDPDARHKGMSAFLVEKGTPGLIVGKTEKKMGVRGSSTAELIFENCRIPAENLIGLEGEGFRICMEACDYTRISTAAQALGIAQGAFDIAFQYAQERKQFGKSIYDFQAIQFMLVDMFTEITNARLLLYQSAKLIDEGSREFTMEASMAKAYCSEVAGRVTDSAVQILGGYGYIRDYQVERMMRDAKITQIYDGTSQIQRMVIARNMLKRLD